MISLKESILSSTNSGKNAKLTKSYLFNLGWKEGSKFNSIITSSDSKHHITKYDFDDIFYTSIYDYNKRLKYLCKIKTIMDFKKIYTFWENTSNLNLYSKEYNEELKKILDYLGRYGYVRNKM